MALRAPITVHRPHVAGLVHGTLRVQSQGRLHQQFRQCLRAEVAVAALAVTSAQLRRAKSRPGGVGHRRVADRCKLRALNKDIPDINELTPSEALRKAAKERAGLRLPEIDEDEHEALTFKSNMLGLGPFREFVAISGGLALASGLYDLFFDFIRLFGRAVRQEDAVEQVKFASAQSVGFGLFLSVIGVALLYTGIMLLEPQTAPTMSDMLKVVDNEEAKAEEVDWSVLVGEWGYGDEGAQRYRIRQERRRTWRFDETLKGESFHALLTPKGKWLVGTMVNNLGNKVGRVRVSVGDEEKTAVTNFQELKALEWGNKNTAYAVQDSTASVAGTSVTKSGKSATV